MNKKISISILVLGVVAIMGIILLAKTQANENGGVNSDNSTRPAAEAAKNALASKLGVSVNEISVTKYEPATWNDGCLGLGGPAESCMQALVDGYRVEMTAQGKTYAYRTDKTGASVRLETNSASEDSAFTVKIGEKKTGSGISITPKEVLEDSRCPKDVQCIRAGTVRLKATIGTKSGDVSKIFTLGQTVFTDTEEITLRDVQPETSAKSTIKSSEYVFSFDIKKK